MNLYALLLFNFSAQTLLECNEFDLVFNCRIQEAESILCYVQVDLRFQGHWDLQVGACGHQSPAQSSERGGHASMERRWSLLLLIVLCHP